MIRDGRANARGRTRPAYRSVPDGREGAMGYDGDVWLAALLLVLMAGLASALYLATRTR